MLFRLYISPGIYNHHRIMEPDYTAAEENIYSYQEYWERYSAEKEWAPNLGRDFSGWGKYIVALFRLVRSLGISSLQ